MAAHEKFTTKLRHSFTYLPKCFYLLLRLNIDEGSNLIARRPDVMVSCLATGPPVGKQKRAFRTVARQSSILNDGTSVGCGNLFLFFEVIDLLVCFGKEYVIIGTQLRHNFTELRELWRQLLFVQLVVEFE